MGIPGTSAELLVTGVGAVVFLVVVYLLAKRFFSSSGMSIGELTDPYSVDSEAGTVKVAGEARRVGEKEIESKYEGKPVIAYAWEEEKITGGGRETIAEGGDAAPFCVTDGNGSVLVDPSDANIDLDKEVVDTGHTKRRLEGYLTEGDEVYVYGQKRENEKTVYIGNGGEVPELVISDSSEMRVPGTQLSSYLP